MAETRPPRAERAPWHLWLIGIFALLWNGMGALDYVMTETRNQAYLRALTPAQLEYIYGFPAWAVAAWALAVWGGVVGCLLLLARKRLAVPVFIVSFIAMVATTIYNFGLSNGMEVMGGPSALAFPAVIFVVALLLVVYTRALRARGVLA
jgi:hypothetical protein